MIGQNGQAKIRVGKSFAALPDIAKFGRLVQTLARLELQCTDGWTAWGGSLRGRGACGPSHGAEQATADRSWWPSERETHGCGHDASYLD